MSFPAFCRDQAHSFRVAQGNSEESLEKKAQTLIPPRRKLKTPCARVRGALAQIDINKQKGPHTPPERNQNRRTHGPSGTPRGELAQFHKKSPPQMPTKTSEQTRFVALANRTRSGRPGASLSEWGESEFIILQSYSTWTLLVYLPLGCFGEALMSSHPNKQYFFLI